MGLVPLVIVLRVGAARLLVGTTNVHDRAFRDGRGPTPIFHLGGGSDDRNAAPATAGDWALALGISLPAIAIGTWLGLMLFRASTTVAVVSAEACARIAPVRLSALRLRERARSARPGRRRSARARGSTRPRARC